ncbi:hypothetical protein ACJX0J_027448, partial [Zea mays]
CFVITHTNNKDTCQPTPTLPHSMETSSHLASMYHVSFTLAFAQGNGITC